GAVLVAIAAAIGNMLQGWDNATIAEEEMALLVEGLRISTDTTIEEYIIGPANELPDEQDSTAEKDKIMLYGPQQGLSWVAQPVTGPSLLGSAFGLVSRQGSIVNQNIPLMDPLVTLFGSVHGKLPEMGSMRSIIFPNFGSMFSVAENHPKSEQWDEEIGHQDGVDYASDGAGGDSDDNLHTPLLSRHGTGMDGKDMIHNSSLMQENVGEAVSSMGIGGGWQLAWKWTNREAVDGTKEGGFKRIYLRQEGVVGSQQASLVSIPGGNIQEEGEYVQAAALVSQPALCSKEIMSQDPAGPAMFAGINGVLYYTPQILKQAGVEVLLANLGIGSDSASILISSLTTLLMLPCIAVAMRLMDVSGRRSLLLATIPVLIVSLVGLVLTNLVDLGSVAHAVFSTICVVVYFCCFVMGFGPIPNILCSEIFPTRVRGVCIAICSLTFWFCDIIVTYSLPVMLNTIGLAGVFGIYAIVCVIALVFVFLKIPETKGMPLEVIIEFFNVGSKQVAKN
ncbi:hypothetical protein BHE74_00010755, partial [Ensete ventricosum]